MLIQKGKRFAGSALAHPLPARSVAGSLLPDEPGSRPALSAFVQILSMRSIDEGCQSPGKYSPSCGTVCLLSIVTQAACLDSCIPTMLWSAAACSEASARDGKTETVFHLPSHRVYAGVLVLAGL